MLTKIDVGHGWLRYKSTTPIRPGPYYRLDFRPDQLTKKRLGTLAAQDEFGRFAGFLCPQEEWVVWVLKGMFVKEVASYGRPNDGIWSVLGLDPRDYYPWQQAFIQDCANCIGRDQEYRRLAIVGLGGGKTRVGLVLAALGDNSVVLAPRHIHQSWRDEAELLGLPCPRISTYESAHRVTGDLDVLILDESVKVKAGNNQRSLAARELSKRAKIVVGLTGTPIAGGGPLDWRQLDIIRPGCIPTNENAFRFCFSRNELDGKEYSADEKKRITSVREVAAGRKAYVTPASAWDLDRVASYVAPFVMRVCTDDLLAHLPPVQYRRLMTPQPKDWDVVVKGAATEKGPSKRVTQASMLSDGFLLDDSGEVIRLDTHKIDAVREFVEGLGEPVVILAAWRETIRALETALATYRPAVIAGGTDAADAQGRFTSGDTGVLIVNAATADGINGLQDRCRVAVFVSLSRQPIDRKQAIGRLFRVGQQRGVVIVDVLAEGTLDERRLELIEQHGDMSESMLTKLLTEELDG